MAEGSLEVKLPAIWTYGKAEVRVREDKESSERRAEKRKSQKKEDAGARKGRKVAKHCFGQCLAEGQKVCSLKRQVRSHLGDEK